MIQLTRTGIRSSSNLGILREEFAAQHTVRLPQLLSADIMGWVAERMASGNWIGKTHSELAQEVILDDSRALQLLHFVANTPDFLAVVRQITSLDAINSFRGRIYRKLPRPDHYIDWHNDLFEGEGRLVGMSLNLSPHPYAGGVFQLRQCGSTDLLRELPNTVCGDAILFRISEALQHQVTAVEGPEPKTAFAGWFKSTGRDLVATMRLHSGKREEQTSHADSFD